MPESAPESIFAEWFARQGTDEEVCFNDLLRENPGHASRLRELRSMQEDLDRVLRRATGSLSNRLESIHGSDADPQIQLDHEGAADFTEAVLSRLSGRRALGRYHIKGEVAHGGMGAVLRVWDEDLKRHLAMKVLLGKGAPIEKGDTPPVDKHVLARFLEEAQVTGQLDHPGIVPIHELGLEGSGQVYFTMKFVQGQTLAEVFEELHEGRGGWTQARTLNLLLKVCEAMSYAHAKSVVHRDIKPANIMVGKYGEVYVMDWGLAKVLGRDESKDIRIRPKTSLATTEVESDRRELARETPDSPLLTMDGTVVGTPSYMPPEQAKGQIGEIGPHSDVYALGAILYHLLVGHAPYVPRDAHLNNYAVWQRVQEGPPRPLLELAPDAPVELAAICEKAMARKPVDRYPSVRDFAMDLQAYLEGRVVPAHRTGIVIEVRKWVKRNQKLAATIVGSLGLIGAVIVSSLALLATKNTELADALGRADEQARVANLSAYSANLFACSAALQSGDITTALGRLDKCSEPLRGWEWRYFHARSDQSLRCLEGHTWQLRALAAGRDGTVISGAGDGTVRVWDLADGTTSFTLPAEQPGALAVAPTGDLLAIGESLYVGQEDPGGVTIWNLETRERVRSLGENRGSCNALAFNPSGELLASTHGSEIGIWEVASGELLGLLEGHSNGVTGLSFHPEEQVLASSSGDVSLRIWDLESMSELRTLRGHRANISDVDFDDTGTRLASASLDGTARIWDYETGDEIAVLPSHDETQAFATWGTPFFHSVDWNEGSTIAVACDDGTVRVWDYLEPDSERVLRGHTEAVERVVFLPGEMGIVSGSHDHTLRHWDVDTSAGVDVFTGQRLGVNSFALSPRGTLAATSSLWEGAVHIWSIATGERLARVPIGRVHGLCFSADEALLLVAHEGEVDAFDLRTGTLVGRIAPHPDEVTTIATSPSSLLAAIGRGETILFWDLVRGRPVHTVEGMAGPSYSACFSPSGELFAVSCNESVVLFDLANGYESIVMEHAGDIEDICFGPNDELLAIGGDDSITLRSLGDQREIGVLEAADLFRAHALCFTAEGDRVLSGSLDGAIRVWHVRSCEELAVLRGHEQGVYGLSLTPDGDVAVSGGGDGTVRIWSTSGDGAWLKSRREAMGERDGEWLGLVEGSRNESAALLAVTNAYRMEGSPGLVRKRIEEDESLTPAVRSAALRLATGAGRPGSGQLNSWAWAIVDPDEGNPEDAPLGLRLARTAASLAPEDPAILDTLAWALFANGMYDEALLESGRALEYAPEEDKGEHQQYLDKLRSMIDSATAVAPPIEDQ